jgi:hypothetical protein
MNMIQNVALVIFLILCPMLRLSGLSSSANYAGHASSFVLKTYVNTLEDSGRAVRLVLRSFMRSRKPWRSMEIKQVLNPICALQEGDFKRAFSLIFVPTIQDVLSLISSKKSMRS